MALIHKEIYRRDRGLCKYCGEKADTVDHILPLSKGGKNTYSNKVLACRNCNYKKGNKLISPIIVEPLQSKPKIQKVTSKKILRKTKKVILNVPEGIPYWMY